MIDDMRYFEVIDLYIKTRKIQIEQEKELDRIKAGGEVRNYIPATTNDW